MAFASAVVVVFIHFAGGMVEAAAQFVCHGIPSPFDSKFRIANTEFCAVKRAIIVGKNQHIQGFAAVKRAVEIYLGQSGKSAAILSHSASFFKRL
jgi:hypothetical protein